MKRERERELEEGMTRTVLGPTDSLGGDRIHGAGEDNGGEGGRRNTNTTINLPKMGRRDGWPSSPSVMR